MTIGNTPENGDFCAYIDRLQQDSLVKLQSTIQKENKELKDDLRKNNRDKALLEGDFKQAQAYIAKKSSKGSSASSEETQARLSGLTDLADISKPDAVNYPETSGKTSKRGSNFLFTGKNKVKSLQKQPSALRFGISVFLIVNIFLMAVLSSEISNSAFMVWMAFIILCLVGITGFFGKTSNKRGNGP